MPDSTSEDDERRIRPFADFLRDQSSGETHEELSEGLNDLIARVRDTGKKGSLVLTVKVSTLKDNDGILHVTDEIKLNLPEHDRKGSVFFADEDNNLSRTDPRQLVFESLREVPAPKFDPQTGEVIDDADHA